jgi:hypothetical protein
MGRVAKTKMQNLLARIAERESDERGANLHLGALQETRAKYGNNLDYAIEQVSKKIGVFGCMEPLAKLLFFVLAEYRKTCREEWMEITNEQLKLELNISSDKALSDARDQLIEYKYIAYKSRQEERLPGLYKILA